MASGQQHAGGGHGAAWAEAVMEIARHLHRLLGRLDPVLLSQINQAREDTVRAGRLLACGSRKTREAFWRGRLGDDNTDYPVMDAHDMALLGQHAATVPKAVQRRALEVALSCGAFEAALALVAVGAPVDRAEGVGGGPSPHGPLAHLVYGDYPNLSREQILVLAEAMMDRDGPAAMRCFNPGVIAHRPVAEAFLRRAPGPQDLDAWKANYIWEPKHNAFARDAVADAFRNADDDTVIAFLEAGFGGTPIDLLARALMSGREGVARALLDWPGFRIDHFVSGKGLPPDLGWSKGWSERLDQDILAEHFWHALAYAWAVRRQARIENNWDGEPAWMSQAMIDRLLKIEALDPTGVDGEGHTPEQVAIDITGIAGPVAALVPRRHMLQLEANTAPATGMNGRGMRL